MDESPPVLPWEVVIPGDAQLRQGHVERVEAMDAFLESSVGA
jgi:hypothetical protein